MNAEQIIAGHHWNADRTYCVGCGKSIRTRLELSAHIADELREAGIDLDHTYHIDGVGISRGIPLYHRRPLEDQ